MLVQQAARKTRVSLMFNYWYLFSDTRVMALCVCVRLLRVACIHSSPFSSFLLCTPAQRAHVRTRTRTQAHTRASAHARTHAHTDAGTHLRTDAHTHAHAKKRTDTRDIAGVVTGGLLYDNYWSGYYGTR